MVDSIREAYDELPYMSYPYPLTHPARLAAVARLAGLSCCDLRSMRVLEFGCAAGGNLAPMAAATPEASFLGVDLSPKQIEMGRAALAELGLANVELEAGDLCDFSAERGEFDFIIAHGVYSWTPPEVADALMKRIRRHLSPTGAAVVSYNLYPGWRFRGLARDLGLMGAAGAKSQVELAQRALAAIELVLSGVRPALAEYREVLASELDTMRRARGGAAYLCHDHLAEYNRPTLFADFHNHAAASGLAYLGEADFGHLRGQALPAEIHEELQRRVPETALQQQTLDHILGLSFRQSVLCRDDAPRTAAPAEEALRDLYVGTNLSGGEGWAIAADMPLELARPDGESFVVTDAFMKSALAILIETAPGFRRFDELCEAAAQRARAELGADGELDHGEFAAEMLTAAALDAVELRSEGPPLATAAGDAPQTTSLARWQAAQQGPVFSLLHRMVDLSLTARLTLQLLDGNRDRTALEEIITDHVCRQGLAPISAGRVVRDVGKLGELVGRQVEADLQLLAKQGLLCG